MTTRSDWQLLRAFIDTGSQTAFVSLTERYIDLVYANCVRSLGDPALAEDATQAVFLVLARRASAFRANIVLATWLFDTCRFVVNDTRRNEARRIARERTVVMEMQTRALLGVGEGGDRPDPRLPYLNNAIGALPKPDRDAVLLHYVCGHSTSELARMLSLSEDGARKRVSRAVEKLRRSFAKAGMTVTVAGIAALAAPRPCDAAPAGLHASAAHAALSTAAAAGGPSYLIAQGALKSMATIKMKSAALATILLLAAGAGTVLTVTHITRNAANAAAANTSPQDTAATSGWVTNFNDPTMHSSFFSQATIDKGLMLRDHWQAWAAAHTDLLQKMLSSEPGDYATLTEVCHALPMADSATDQKVAGITNTDIIAGGNFFTWQPVELRDIDFDSLPQSHISGRSSLIMLLKKNFDQSHDIIISDSANIGPKQLCLWASGRVTVTLFTMTRVGRHLPFKVTRTSTEIAPRYSFLK